MIKMVKTDILTRRIAWSTLVQYAGKIILLLIAMSATKLLTNFFTKSDYGQYAWIIEYCLFFSVAANLGLFANSVRLLSARPGDEKVFVNAMILRIGTALLIFLIALLIAPFLPYERYFTVCCVLFILALLFDFATMICDALLQANYLMGRATFALVIGKVCYLGALVLFFRYCPADNQGQYIPVVFLFTLLGSGVTCGLSCYFAGKKIRWHWKPDFKLCLTILKTGIPFGLINIVNYLYFRFLPMALAKKYLTTAQFSTFDISFRIAFVFSLFSTFLMFSVMPAFKQSLIRQEWDFARKLYNKSKWLLLGCGVLLVIFGSLLGPKMIEFLTSKNYFVPEFWFILPLFLTLAAISYFYDLVLITLFSFHQDFWLLKREVIALTTGLLFFGISYFLPQLQVKILFIIAGAITGELTMVIMGLARINRQFKNQNGKLQNVL